MPSVSPRRTVNEISSNSPGRPSPRTSSITGLVIDIARVDVMVERLAGHKLGDARLCHAFGRVDADQISIAQDGHPAGDLKHLRQPWLTKTTATPEADRLRTMSSR